MKEILELDIIDITNEGNGVGKDERLTYFVEGAKIGERVLAKAKEYKKNFALAKKIETIEPSPFLEPAKCIYANICDGCQFQDINYKKQIDLKKNSIINSINRIARENIEDIDFQAFEQRYNYRNKVELKVDLFGNISYFSRKTNDNVAIKECIIANEKINQIIEVLQEAIYDLELRGFDNRRNQGFIKNIMIRATSIGESMVVMVLAQEKNLDQFISILEKSGLIDSFYTSINSKRNNYKILRTKLIFGKEKIKEKMGDKEFLISPKSFFQVNTKQAYNIYLDAKKIIEDKKTDNIIDLYSGISTTSIILSDIAKKIISVEIVEDAVKDGKENAQLNSVKNIEFIQDDAGKAIDKINLEVENPLLLVDPPRKGLDPNIIFKIGKSNINNIVYISCNPATLARDIKAFKEHGFKIEYIKGYDMFVNTLHVECLVLLSKVAPTK